MTRVPLVLRFVFATVIAMSVVPAETMTGPFSAAVKVTESRTAEAERRPVRPRRPKARNIVVSGCRIREQGKVWHLLANCRANRTIELPAGKTFNGRGRTIFPTGNASRFGLGVLYASRGLVKIHNLTIDGSNLGCSCGVAGSVTGIAVSGASADLRNVTVDRLDIRGDCSTGISFWDSTGTKVFVIANSRVWGGSATGIQVSGGRAGSIRTTTVDITGSQFGAAISLTVVRNFQVADSIAGALRSSYGIRLSSSGNVSVLRNYILTSPGPSLANFGIYVTGESSGILVQANGVNGFAYGISLDSASVASVANNVLQFTFVGIEIATSAIVDVTNNAIFGPSNRLNLSGIGLHSGGGGSIQGNWIRTFDCGIRIASDSGAVNLGTNNVMDNNEPICDERAP